MNVGRWVEKWSQVAPAKVGVVDEGREFTYRQLNDQANQLARFLLDRDLRKGDRVGVLLYNGHQYLEIYVALAKVGAVLVPLNWRMADPELEGVIEDSGTRFLIFDASFHETADFLRKSALPPEVFIVLGDEPALPWAARYSDSCACPTTDPSPDLLPDDEEPHILLYSSGTTGHAKGILLSHRKTFYNALNADMFYQLNSADVLLVHRPLFHSGGLLVNVTPALYKGAKLILKRRFSPREYLEAVQEYRVTVIEAAATLLLTVAKELDLGAYDLRSIKACFTGGERVPESLLRHYHSHGVPLSQIFGMSETSTTTFLASDDAMNRPGSVGRPVFHGDVRIVDADMRDVAPGEVGEIVISGPILMSGYWKQPELTEQAFRDGWFVTGDLARRDEEGFIYIVDRKKDMFISGGENVYPAEVEKVLTSHPEVEDAAVSGVPDDRWGEVGKAWVVLKETATATPDDILRYLDGKIGRFKIPKHVQFVSSLPRTASGKIQRYLLVQRDGTTETL